MKKQPLLIVNADDCNLTPGVTRAILECHDRGIVTSTTFMINLPVNGSTVRSLKSRKQLGIGLHLNITLGKPVSAPSRVKSLLNQDGRFYKIGGPETRLRAEVLLEYQNQINRFKKTFGRKPTHLDTHHQLHDDVFFLKILAAVAKKNGLPFRRSKLMQRRTVRTGLGRWSKMSPDRLLGDLSVRGYWKRKGLERALKGLKGGINELMCHPGRVDADLRQISSFTSGRAVERKLFASAELRKSLIRQGVRLTHYGICYT